MVVDIAAEAKTLERFEFIARFVARCTSTRRGREPVNGMQVKKARGGWVYTIAGLTACVPCDSRKLYEMILRNDLDFYVRQADEFRADVLTTA